MGGLLRVDYTALLPWHVTSFCRRFLLQLLFWPEFKLQDTHFHIQIFFHAMASPKDIHTEALVVSKPGGDFVMQPIILDEVRSDEVLVEMKYSGICHTVRNIPFYILYQILNLIENRIFYFRRRKSPMWNIRPSLAMRVPGLFEPLADMSRINLYGLETAFYYPLIHVESVSSVLRAPLPVVTPTFPSTRA